MNYIIDSEQKFHLNQTHNINESDLTRFISQLSDYKEKIVACYDEQYLTIGERLQSPGTHDQVLTFISRNYNETVTTITIESLLDALNRTISSFYLNQQQRIYKRNIPVGSGIGPDGIQIFIQDTEYYETDDQAVQVLKRYEQINQDNLNMLNFQVIIFGSQVKRSVANILSRVIFLTRMSISNLSEYIEHQTQHITTLENYTTIPQSVDILGQHAIQICTTVKRFDDKLGGILCTSVPVTEMFPSKGISYIIDTRKKMLIAKNANVLFNYNYFVTTLQPQHFSHMNQYNKTSIEINGSLYITENINIYTRLIIQFRNVDKNKYKLIQPVQKTQLQFKFDKCSYGLGFMFNTNNMYQVDCDNPEITTDYIFSSQFNYEAQLLLSDITFQQLNKLNIWSGNQRTVGRMTRNNLSTVFSNFVFDSDCWKQIQDNIYNFRDHEDFNTNQFHYNRLSCYYEINNNMILDDFVLLIHAHQNLLFTDFVIYPSSFVQYLFNFGQYNVITSDLETLNKITDNQLQTLFSNGILLCKLYDQPDYLYKGIKLGNLQRINSDIFRHLNYLNGIIFTVIDSPFVNFNCSKQIFSNDLMKNNQDRPYYCINVYHQAHTHIIHQIDYQNQYLFILLAICFAILIQFALSFM
ncbi:Hypothetical_protein [Hexamita inflata]|uniref:Hypothetical_protein n=1 Tax=Hexamita inflata TaxID=28002 RepID=A0AA86PRY4_9EUKA|nr:Hypothetical protein HINF_LOCUS28060 [Hexamita inflata]